MSGFDNIKPNIGANLNSQISGIISTKPTAKYASGARTILKINEKIVGFSFAISWRINTSVVEINTIDNYLPHELAPQRITVEGTMSALHIPGQSAGTELWQPDVLNFLLQQYVTLEVRDSQTDQLLFFADRVMITSRAEELRVDSLANVQLSWKAVGFRDERAPEFVPDANTPEVNKNPQSRITSEAFSAINNQLGKLPFGSDIA